VQQPGLHYDQEEGHQEAAGVGGEKGPKPEGTPVPVVVGEGNHRFRMLGLVA